MRVCLSASVGKLVVK